MSTGSKYVDRLNLSKEVKEKRKAETNAKRAKAQIDKDIADAKADIDDKDDKIDELKNAFPLDTPAIIKLQREKAVTEQNIKDLETLSKELF